MEIHMKINYSWLCAAGLCGVLSASATAQQASLTLKNSDAKICYTNNNAWTLTKTSDKLLYADGETVNWHIQATKSYVNTTYSVHGAMTITNTGSANASIGNIVINLQKPNNVKIGGKNVPWVSAAADVATSFSGDSATVANIVAGGSAESQPFNFAFGAINYTVAGAKGTFTEGAASGSMEFTDVNGNTVWALNPAKVLAPGETVTLLYTANFSAALGAQLAGKSVRVEALVTFGNAGARGGSGASATNIDISGNGSVDADEANVRTVPSRITINSPAVPEECNDEATVTDKLPLGVTDFASYDGAIGFDLNETINVTTGWDVSVVAQTLLPSGGTLTNTANLFSAGDSDTLVIGYGPIDPLTGLPTPIYATFSCCGEQNLQATSTVTVTEDGGGGNGGGGGNTYHSYSQGGYQGNGVPGQIMINNFITVFSGGLVLGVEDGAGFLHDATWTATVAGRTALRTFLGGGGPSGPLTSDTQDATSVSGGNLTKQMAALTLNVGFSGVVPGMEAGFGGLVYNNPSDPLDAFNGKTVAQILAMTNLIMTGAALPGSYTYGTLNQLITDINVSWDNGVQTSWAMTHLS